MNPLVLPAMSELSLDEITVKRCELVEHENIRVSLKNHPMIFHYISDVPSSVWESVVFMGENIAFSAIKNYIINRCIELYKEDMQDLDHDSMVIQVVISNNHRDIRVSIIIAFQDPNHTKVGDLLYYNQPVKSEYLDFIDNGIIKRFDDKPIRLYGQHIRYFWERLS